MTHPAILTLALLVGAPPDVRVDPASVRLEGPASRYSLLVEARIGDEVTVKRFRRTKNLIELLPENPDFKTIVVEPGEPFALEGLAVGLIRNTVLN